MLTEMQKNDVRACYERGFSEMETLDFIMTKYCVCELPAYKPRETVYNYIVDFYSQKMA